MSKTL